MGTVWLLNCNLTFQSSFSLDESVTARPAASRAIPLDDSEDFKEFNS